MVKPMETAVDERTGPVRFRPMNPMCDAAEQGDLPTLTVLLATGGNVNELGENGNSALAFACANGHADCTSLLISRGATVDLRSSLGNSPLHAACWADSPKCIRIPAWSKRPPLQCPSSALVPPQGAPGGSGRLGAPRGRPGHSDPGRCLGCSSLPPPIPPIPSPLTIQVAAARPPAKLTRTPRSLRTVRTGYAYQPPACCTHLRRRAACPGGRHYCTYAVHVPASAVPYVPRTVAPQAGRGSATTTASTA